MYKSILEGKRVALVAPGAQTEIMKIGPLIDSYDLVARVGIYTKLVPDEVGSRTDILCENFWEWTESHEHLKRQELYDEWMNQGVKMVRFVWMSTDGLIEFAKLDNNRTPVYMQSPEIQKAIRNVVGSPTKGMCSIWDFLVHPIKELFLVGFTSECGFGYRKDLVNNPFQAWRGCNVEYFDPHETSKNYDMFTRNIRHADHDHLTELNWLKGVKNDPRVKFDEWSERILACENWRPYTLL